MQFSKNVRIASSELYFTYYSTGVRYFIMNVLRKAHLPFTKFVSYGMHRGVHSAPQLLKEKDFYDVLRIPKDASQSDIKNAYYKLSKVYHPDVKKDESSLAMFRLITEAYDVLGHVKNRQEYDKKEYGKGEDYDTSKEAFYGSLYKDKVFQKARAPNYETLFDKRSALEKYLDEEEKDRKVELEVGTKQRHEHSYDQLGEYGGERLLQLMYFVLTTHFIWHWLEDKYDWGLP